MSNLKLVLVVNTVFIAGIQYKRNAVEQFDDDSYSRYKVSSMLETQNEVYNNFWTKVVKDADICVMMKVMSF